MRKSFRVFSVSLLTFGTLIVLPLSVSAANATVYFLEPSIGYRTETLKLIDKSQNETRLKTSTPVFGLKLGLQSATGILFNLAGDYSSGKTQPEPDLTNPPDFKHSSAAVQVGISAMGLMKIYLGYAFLNQFEVDTTSTYNGFKLSGPAYQVGMMFSPFSKVSLGAQYNIHQYKEITGPAYSGSSEVSQYFDKVDSQDLSLQISLTF